jgi:5-formyltetrahydrofolate cyclo-ligase
MFSGSTTSWLQVFVIFLSFSLIQVPSAWAEFLYIHIKHESPLSRTSILEAIQNLHLPAPSKDSAAERQVLQSKNPTTEHLANAWLSHSIQSDCS